MRPDERRGLCSAARSARVRIRPFETEWAGEISGWPATADEARAWAGSETSFPVRPEHVLRWHADPDVQAYVGWQPGGVVAYGELWGDRSAHEVEVGRVIVRRDRRCGGLGRLFVRKLISQAQRCVPAAVYVRVIPGNEGAIRCYASAGFLAVDDGLQKCFNQGQPRAYVWMQYAGHLMSKCVGELTDDAQRG